MTHICVSKLTTLDSDNGAKPLSEPRLEYRQPLVTNFSEMLIEIRIFSFIAFENIVWKMAAKIRGVITRAYPNFHGALTNGSVNTSHEKQM